MSRVLSAILALTVVCLWMDRSVGEESPASPSVPYRVGFLGQPASSEAAWVRKIEWNKENLGRLKELGFTVVQIDVAWTRPDDEILCIEDLVELSPEQQKLYPQPVPLRSKPGAESRAARQDTLRRRLAMVKQMGLRTLLLVGAPYNSHARYGDAPPNCILDDRTVKRHVLMLQQLARVLPGLDDLQVYTYDVDAWLCSQFAGCPRCRGVPLHERLPVFVAALASAWHRINPDGRLWWEPWELSSGQGLKCIETIAPEGLGLVMHCNSAECMATLAVDRWVKNMGTIARRRGIPVMIQYFLGGTSEETEPYFLAHPLVTLRGLKAIASVSGLSGIKEYYGLCPDRDDPNLRMTALFFRNPQITEEDALEQLARPYGQAASDMICFWRLTSEGMEMFPWETTWFIREVGRSRVDHSLSAATLRGMDISTPSWRSSRHGTFMRIEPAYPPHPWMLEDIQLRCEAAADRMRQALDAGRQIEARLPEECRKEFALVLLDQARFHRRALAYAYHLRETNLATCLRAARKDHQSGLADRLARQLLELMNADLRNVCSEKEAKAGAPTPAAPPTIGVWPEMDAAIDRASKDLDTFLGKYFGDAPDRASRGVFSATSR